MASLSEMAEGINILKVAFPNFQPDIKRTADLWLAVLGDLPGDLLKAAILEKLTDANRAFAPSVGEIRSAATHLLAIAQGVPDALRAYDEVARMPIDMIRREYIVENGQNIILQHPVGFSHPLVSRVAHLIGWPKTFPTDMPAADRSQFIRLYDAELNREMSNNTRLPQVNQYLADNRSNALLAMQNVSRQLGVR